MIGAPLAASPKPTPIPPWEIAAWILAAGIVAAQLLVPPVVGLANNGDYESVMGYVGFQYLTQDHGEKYFQWIMTKFAYGPPGWFKSGLLTSEALIAWLARLISEPFAHGGFFDLRVLGATHGLLLVAGLALLIRSTAPLSAAARWTAAALLVFFFTDVGYVAPLNSFYSQAASLVFLVLTLGIAAWTVAFGRSWTAAALYFLCALAFVGSKPQEVIQAPLLALFGLRLFGDGLRRLHRQPAAWAAAALCAFSLWYFRQTPYADRRSRPLPQGLHGAAAQLARARSGSRRPGPRSRVVVGARGASPTIPRAPSSTRPFAKPSSSASATRGSCAST